MTLHTKELPEMMIREYGFTNRKYIMTVISLHYFETEKKRNFSSETTKRLALNKNYN